MNNESKGHFAGATFPCANGKVKRSVEKATSSLELSTCWQDSDL